MTTLVLVIAVVCAVSLVKQTSSIVRAGMLSSLVFVGVIALLSLLG